MAIDTIVKRKSAAAVGKPWLIGIEPDGTKGAPWRQSVGRGYAGITVIEPVVVISLKRITVLPAANRTTVLPAAGRISVIAAET